MIRYFCALIWMCVLSCFSYGDLILNFFDRNGIPLEDKILASHSSTVMILANIGLVVMLYIDKFIMGFITKQKNKNQSIDAILIAAIILAVVMTVFAQLINNEGFIPIDWFKLSYLLILFILLLIIYKAETLKIKHISSNTNILPTKNI